MANNPDTKIAERFHPAPRLPIWHYMEFPKFMSLLHFQELHFTRADRFEDIFEKKMADIFLKEWPADRRESYERIRRSHLEETPRTFISCWTNLDKESYAMWQIYARENGVAVQTTVENLEKALNNAEIKICKVHYLDFAGKDSLHSTSSFWDEKKEILRKNFYICKPKAYEYEREIRAVILEDKEDNFINIEADVETLIENIYISPFASRWFVDLVEDLACRRYGLKEKNIYMSDIKLNKGPY